MVLDFAARGDVDTEAVVGAVIGALWGDEEGRWDTGVVGGVSADVIFDADSGGELAEWVGGIWAPCALKSFSVCFGQTIRAIEDAG